ncbi:MAG: HAMP domain-containing histidine kinase [Hahellaceae bacterium]|nr:HAMP domain-containing histidine kinase [Hahellaceae bacterium]
MTLSRRVFQRVFWSNLAGLLLAVAVAWHALEDLEAVTLAQDEQVELAYLLESVDKRESHHFASGTLVFAYLPADADRATELPVLFNQVPVPFRGELEILENEYEIITGNYDHGTYYFAKDLAVFEARESAYGRLFLGFIGAVIAVSLLLAVLTARQISRPLSRLAREALDPASVSGRVDENYQERELRDIAQAVNRYQDQQRLFLTRERDMIAMASHELRTPIAVVLGAAEVIEKRGRLQDDDARTLERILRSAREMSENVHGLLLLRRGATADERQAVALRPLLEQLCGDYQQLDAANEPRLSLEWETREPFVNAEPALLRMLMHNLISNALAHTTGAVNIRVSGERVSICDDGGESSMVPHLMPIQSQTEERPVGLGLYICTLVCERYRWHFKVDPYGRGQCVTIHFADKVHK